MTVVRCNVCKREISPDEGHYHVGPVSFVELGAKPTDIVEALAADELRERFIGTDDIDVCIPCWEKVKAAIAAVVVDAQVDKAAEGKSEGKLPN